MSEFFDLPAPSPSEVKRSRALQHFIETEINKRGGKLSFADYMAFSLSHPEWGYYTAPDFQFGEGGDFTTAPELTPLFAYCIAQQCETVLRTENLSIILELGAGSGRLAGDLMHWLQKKDCLPDQYIIVEPSASLRKKQAQYLQSHFSAFSQRIHWLEAPPASFEGIILANEVLDALPVQLFCIEKERVEMRYVKSESGQFTWALGEPEAPLLTRLAYLQDTYSLPSGYCSEWNTTLPTFIKNLAMHLQKGLMLFIDYGYGEREYYHPLRKEGTLQCFYRHRKHQNPLIYPGLQDITAHVNFSQVMETAAQEGCEYEGFSTQANFLLALGLVDLVSETEKHLSTAEAFKLHQAIKTLTLPTEMGERIKVLGVSKGLKTLLQGFSLEDRGRDL